MRWTNVAVWTALGLALGGVPLLAPLFAGEKISAQKPLWSKVRWGDVGLLDSADENEAGITALAVSSDGKLLATGHAGGQVRLWNSWTGVERAVLAGHPEEVAALAFSDQGRTLLSFSQRRLVRWDAAAGKKQSETLLKISPFDQALFTPDGNSLVIAFKAGTVRILDAVKAGERRKLHRPAGPVFGLALSPDGQAAACGEEGGGITVWNLKTGDKETALPAQDLHLPRAVAFSPDGKLLGVALGRDGVMVWDRTAKRLLTHVRTAPRSAAALAFTPDSRGLTIGAANGLVLTQDLPAKPGDAVATIVQRAHAGQAQRTVFLPGQRLATTGTDCVVRLWRAYLPGEAPSHPAEPKLTAAEAASLLDDLSAGAAAADRAARTMQFMPEQAVALLRRHIQPVAHADAQRFAKLLADLDQPAFAVRQKAFLEMERMEEGAKDLIHAALEDNHDLETHQRLQLLAKRLAIPDGTPRARLHLRGVDVLARINSPAARRFLEELADGVASAHLTQAARRALEQGK